MKNNKFRRYIYVIFCLIFFLFITGSLFLSIITNGNYNYAVPNKFVLVILLIVLLVLGYIIRKPVFEIMNRYFKQITIMYWALGILLVLVFAWATYGTTFTADDQLIDTATREYFQTGVLEDKYYLKIYPTNYFLQIVSLFLYKISIIFHLSFAFVQTISNVTTLLITQLFTYLIANKYLSKRGMFYFYIISIFFFSFAFHIADHYNDVYLVLYPIAGLYFFDKSLLEKVFAKKLVYIFIGALVLGIGAMHRPVTLIVWFMFLFTIILIEFSKNMLKKYFIIFIISLVGFVPLFSLNFYISNNKFFEVSSELKKAHNFTDASRYTFDNKTIQKYRNQEIPKTDNNENESANKVVDSAGMNYQIFINKFLNGLKQYQNLFKTQYGDNISTSLPATFARIWAIIYTDGTFHYEGEFGTIVNGPDNTFANNIRKYFLPIEKGIPEINLKGVDRTFADRPVSYFYNFMHALWVLLLICILLGARAYINDKNRNRRLINFIMFGSIFCISVYTIMTEMNPRYLYLYLPFYILAGCFCLEQNFGKGLPFKKSLERLKDKLRK
jgi:hypothetical protein